MNANVKFDIYRAGNGLPNPPDVSQQSGLLIGRETNLKTTYRYDYKLIVDANMDIRGRDGTGAVPGDDIYIPDKNCLTTGGVRLKVYFVEFNGFGTVQNKTCYCLLDVIQYPTIYG